MSIAWLIAACARIMKVFLGEETFLGSGYLIDAKWVATAGHVVQGLEIGHVLAVRFPNKEPCRAYLRHRDSDPSDCALLELETALPDVAPLRLATMVPDRGRWLGFGFPDGAKNHGLPFGGTIAVSQDTDPHKNGPAIQLDFDKHSSGSLHGLSGGPVTDEAIQRVLGHFIVRIPDEGGAAQFAKIWAYPSKQTLALCQSAGIQVDTPPSHLEEREPPYSYDENFQVRKQEEAQALRLLQEPGPPVFLVGPTGCGKTLLWTAIIKQLRDKNQVKVAHASMGQFDEIERAQLGSFLKAWAMTMAQQLSVEHSLVESVWNRPHGAKSKLNVVMVDLFLSKIPDKGRLVLALEQLDDLWPRPFADDFFQLLKSWADASAMNEQPWGKLRMLFSSSISPTYLVRGKGTSLYPRPVDLCDLDSRQCAEMVSYYCLHSMAPIIEQLIERIGGNPYLLMLAMHHLAAGRVTAEQLLTDEGVNVAFGRHLLDLQQWLELNQTSLIGLQDILAGAGSSVSQEVIVGLMMRGLVISDAQGHRVRYGLYQRYFSGYFQQRQKQMTSTAEGQISP
jgi:Cdc6-like AAA superfamily ATPase